jgi:CRP/FNR family transcriptional regulator
MSDIAEQLHQAELFRDVDLADLTTLASVMESETYAPHEVIFRWGDVGDTMYIIQEGRVRIYTFDSQGNELTIRYYGKSDIFGEFSLLDNQPRSASASVTEATTLLTLQRDDFMDFLIKHPQISLTMMRSLSRRARYTTSYLEEAVNWARRLARGEYQQALEEITHSQQEEGGNQIQGLLGAFLEMVKNVQEREQKLQQELVRLQVQIDQSKRETQVETITRSEFFSKLKSQARELRAQTLGASPEAVQQDDTPPPQVS